MGLTFGIGSAFLATMAPALTASRVMPVEAGRTVSPPGQGRASLPERLLPWLLRRLSPSWKGVLDMASVVWLRSA